MMYQRMQKLAPETAGWKRIDLGINQVCIFLSKCIYLKKYIIMKKIITTAVMLFTIIYSNAQQPDSDAMKAWQNFMTPGEVHKMLASSNGIWDEEITMWMAPGAPPEKAKAKAENKMILNGLYQQSTSTGNFGGMPFEGISTTGYDNGRKMFMSTWIDNMGSSITYMEGTWDEATKTVNMKGKQTDPMTGKVVDVRETLHIIDGDTQMMEMFETKDGKERKTMEIKFTRSK
jgi:hypothetical protein